jgi:transcriptional regulator with XRE-family HTH domain
MIAIKLMSPAEISIELGYRLKSRRLALRMTQKELAARTDLNVGTIKNLEAKTAGSTLDTLIRIAGVLGVSDQFETLFLEKPKSISQMEQVATAPRVRARRSRHQ